MVLNKENERLAECLDISTKSALTKTLEEELILNHESKILENEEF